MTSSESFERIAATAARLFMANGFAGVSLRAIADELGIKPASLYYHCPRGKSELFGRALVVFFERYQSDLSAAAGRSHFPQSLFRMTDWMLEHPPVDLQRIVRTDLPQLAEEDASPVMEALHASVLQPFVRLFERAQADGKLGSDLDPAIAAAAVVALVDGLGFQHLAVGAPPSTAELREARHHVHTALRLLKGID